MAFSHLLHAEAYTEYIDAYLWYEKERKGLGEQFIAATDILIEKICQHPQYYSRIKGAYRQANVDGFPYLIVFKIFHKRKLVLVTAIHHTSRSPKTKFRK